MRRKIEILSHNAGRDEENHEAGVDMVYMLLWLKENDPEKYAATVEFGKLYTWSWDEPKGDVLRHRREAPQP